MVGVKPNLTAKQTELLEALEAKQRGGNITPKQTITLGDLLSKKLAKPTLSATTKTYLEQLHKEVIFNRRNEIRSKYLDKGIQVEEQAITLYSEVTDTLFIKNKERRKNAFITGEADNVQGKIRDIKSSWDLSTFPMHETKIKNPDYYWQLQGYQELWNLDESELIYCLVDTPDMLIDDEKRKTSWKLGFLDLPDDLDKEITESMKFADIPKELRCKVFNLDRDKDAMRQLENQILLCREYLNGLTEKLNEAVLENKK
jgi:hypothetical protein